MAQSQSAKIISKIEWIRPGWLSTKKSLYTGPASSSSSPAVEPSCEKSSSPLEEREPLEPFPLPAAVDLRARRACSGYSC